jgi:hypothetical protein
MNQSKDPAATAEWSKSKDLAATAEWSKSKDLAATAEWSKSKGLAAAVEWSKSKDLAATAEWSKIKDPAATAEWSHLWRMLLSYYGGIWSVLSRNVANLRSVLFLRCLVRISAGLPAVLTEIFLSFPSSPRAAPGYF